MKIYTKILITTLPLVCFFLVSAMGISYYFSRSALTDLAEEWLSARSSEALSITGKHEKILHQYGLEKIHASILKAQLDTFQELYDVKIGTKGYILIIDKKGNILFHPRKLIIGRNISHENWFQNLKNKKEHIFFSFDNKKNIAICNFFSAWEWFILVVAPEEEVYGLANRMKPYLIFSAISATLIISLALFLLTRHLTKPLQSLVNGAKQIGQGHLNTQITIKTKDEIADLASEFNNMIFQLKKIRTALKNSHEELEQKVEERTRELVLANQTLSREIQDGKIKEDELKKANQVKNEFLANISHEIRTPLNSVIGFSELLLARTEKKEKINYLTTIHTAGTRLLSLINDIMDLAKIESGRMELNTAKVNIKCLIDEIHQLFQSDMQKKSIQFIKTIDDQIPGFLILDDIRFQQILVNLIGNAVKFTHEGFIKVSLQQIKYSENSNKLDLEVSVKDTGIGIPEDQQETIFKSFQQASLQINREYGGTGLGLSICRHLSELMGGHIQVRSTMGKGSIFTVILPGIEISPDRTDTHIKQNRPLEKGPGQKDSEIRISLKTLRRCCSENYELKYQLHTHILQNIPELKQGIKINDIQNIITNIISIGDKFQIPELKLFGEKLSEYARSFDIEKLRTNLQTLYKILKSIPMA